MLLRARVWVFWVEQPCMQIQAHLQLEGRGELGLETEVLSGTMVIGFTRGELGSRIMSSELTETQSRKAGPVLCPLMRNLP